MRQLTFEGFLSRYLATLSNSGEKSVRKLSREAANGNPRLREPLMLYALMSQKTDLLMSEIKNDKLAAEYRYIAKQYDKKNIKPALENGDEKLPPEYLKVWRSYVSERDRFRADTNTKELMRKRILLMQKQKNVSNYRVYTDLSLNPGNVNAWLKHGDGRKVSLDIARRILRYLEDR